MNTIIETADDVRRCQRFLDGLSLGKQHRWKFSCRLVRKVRTLDQNKLYWAWLRCISADTKNTSDELHTYYKKEFLPKRHIEIGSQMVEVDGSTKELDTMGFSDFLRRVYAHADDFFGVKLVWPEDPRFDAFYSLYGEG